MDVIREMQRQFELDKSVIDLFQIESTSQSHQVSGIWQTFQGEIYVAEGYKPDVTDTKKNEVKDEV